MANAGRPSGYTLAMASSICQRLASGESLRSICEENTMPGERTVYGWLVSEEAFSQEYARARKTWADAQIEEVLAVSRDLALAADHKRVQIDTLKWAMGKLNGKYSDKLKHVGGDDDDTPIQHSMIVEFVDGLADQPADVG